MWEKFAGNNQTKLRIVKPLLNTLGFLLQFAALVLLPLLIIWQLSVGFKLVMMPLLTLAGFVTFMIGHALREKV